MTKEVRNKTKRRFLWKLSVRNARDARDACYARGTRDMRDAA